MPVFLFGWSKLDPNNYSDDETNRLGRSRWQHVPVTPLLSSPFLHLCLLCWFSQVRIVRIDRIVRIGRIPFYRKPNTDNLIVR